MYIKPSFFLMALLGYAHTMQAQFADFDDVMDGECVCKIFPEASPNFSSIIYCIHPDSASMCAMDYPLQYTRTVYLRENGKWKATTIDFAAPSEMTTKAEWASLPPSDKESHVLYYNIIFRNNSGQSVALNPFGFSAGDERLGRKERRYAADGRHRYTYFERIERDEVEVITLHPKTEYKTSKPEIISFEVEIMGSASGGVLKLAFEGKQFDRKLIPPTATKLQFKNIRARVEGRAVDLPNFEYKPNE